MKFTADNWPYGKLRTTATFEIEQTKRGERAVRTTVNPKTGRINKPKKTTYATKTRIVDGSDDRTYIAELTMYGTIYIRMSDLVHEEETAHSDDERYTELLTLFND